jgi:hypothetical protein
MTPMLSLMQVFVVEIWHIRSAVMQPRQMTRPRRARRSVPDRDCGARSDGTDVYHFRFKRRKRRYSVLLTSWRVVPDVSHSSSGARMVVPPGVLGESLRLKSRPQHQRTGQCHDHQYQ